MEISEQLIDDEVIALQEVLLMSAAHNNNTQKNEIEETEPQLKIDNK